MSDRLILRRNTATTANPASALAGALKNAGVDVLEVTEDMILVDGDERLTAELAGAADGWRLFPMASLAKPAPVTPKIAVHRRKRK